MIRSCKQPTTLSTAAIRYLALTLALTAAIALGTPAAPASAMEWRTGDTISVPTGTRIDDDLFAAGQTVTIAGQVTGDVYAFAQSVTVTGTIDRDLIAAAQQVTIDGTVRGDLRVAGQHVLINGRVDGNVTSAGQVVSLGRQGRVDGSILGAAQDLNLVGPVGRGVAAAADTLNIAGSVGGNVDAQVDRLVVDPGARIGGRVAYTSEREATVPAGSAAGGVQFTRAEREDRRQDSDPAFGGLFDFFGLVWLIGSIIAGVLLVHFLPRFAAGAAAQVREHPWPTFGIGILALFVIPAAALLAAITLIGLPLSFVAGLSYLIALYAGWLVLGLAVGQLLYGLARRRADTLRAGPEWLVVLGLLVLYVVTHVPLLGGLITFVTLSLGLGALVREILDRRAAEPTALPPPAPAPPAPAPPA
jgi:cytoskeletal protein CcmA (bactofilin family)